MMGLILISIFLLGRKREGRKKRNINYIKYIYTGIYIYYKIMYLIIENKSLTYIAINDSKLRFSWKLHLKLRKIEEKNNKWIFIIISKKKINLFDISAFN